MKNLADPFDICGQKLNVKSSKGVNLCFILEKKQKQSMQEKAQSGSIRQRRRANDDRSKLQ
jgi:hypothetical protein